jgi:hypothetical protein
LNHESSRIFAGSSLTGGLPKHGVVHRSGRSVLENLTDLADRCTVRIPVGQVEKADADYQTAVTLQPGLEMAREAMEQLDTVNEESTEKPDRR